MMKKLEFSKELELDLFYEKLDNGLEIYLVPMKNKDKYFLTYATKFGSTTTTFTKGDSKEEVTVPDGIAHFLEHKMLNKNQEKIHLRSLQKVVLMQMHQLVMMLLDILHQVQRTLKKI